MAVHQTTLSIRTRGPGTYEITDAVAGALRQSGMVAGIATVFCQHTSCSLVLMENADPSARSDLEAWLDRLVPADDPHFTHTLEGAAAAVKSRASVRIARASMAMLLMPGSRAAAMPARGPQAASLLW